MALQKKEENRVYAKVFFWLCSVSAVVLLVVGVGLCKAGSMAVTQVNDGLKAAKVYFPPEGPAFSAEVYPDIQEYAGKQVVDGGVSKIYAEDFLGKQLELMAGGKVLSEVSAQLAADPTNAQLGQLQAAMFQMQMSKDVMLADSYGTWMQGKMFKTVGMTAIVAAAALVLIAVVHWMRYKRA